MYLALSHQLGTLCKLELEFGSVGFLKCLKSLSEQSRTWEMFFLKSLSLYFLSSMTSSIDIKVDMKPEPDGKRKALNKLLEGMSKFPTTKLLQEEVEKMYPLEASQK